MGALGGPINITNAGYISATGNGVRAIGLDPGSPVTVTNSGTLIGGTVGVFSNTNTSTTINNSGFLTATSLLAIDTVGASTAITNSGPNGVIRGFVDLTNNNDTFNNQTGALFDAFFTSEFRGGFDLLTNDGTIRAARNAAVDETVRFNGLELLDNGGLITMVDGHEGDRLFTSGNYNGRGNAQYATDAFLGPNGSRADVFNVLGNVTGNTGVLVHDTNPGLGAFNTTGIAVVGINGTGNVNNFQLSPGSSHFDPKFGGVLDKGFFFYFLANDPNATSTGCELNHCVSLYSAPDVEAFQLPRAITAAQNIFYETALMWEDRQTEVRDWWARGRLADVRGAGADMPVKARPAPAPLPPPPPRYGVWLKGMGSWTDRNDSQTETLVGHTFNFDLGYKQDTYGIVGGFDFATPAFTNDVFVFGPMGGYLNSKVRFNEGGTTFKYTGGTVGFSGSYLSGGYQGAGGWFADGLVKADFLRLSIDMPSVAANGGDFGHVDVTTWGVIGNLGYRFNFGSTSFGSAFLEPIGTLTYAQTNIDDINNGLLGTNIHFGKGDSFRGAIGARLGTQLPNWWAGHISEAWILGRVWDEFAGDNNTVDLLNPGAPFAVADDNIHNKAFGEVKGGLDLIAMGAGWSAHVNGGAKFNDDFTSWNAKGGVSYKW